MAAPPPSPTAPKPARPSRGWFIVLGILALLWLLQSGLGAAARPTVDYSTMLGWVRAGKVKEVVLRPDSVTGTLSAPQNIDGKTASEFSSALPKDDRLVPLLDDKGVKIRVENEDS